MKNKCNKWKTVTDIGDVNPTTSIIIFNINGLNAPVKD